MSKHPTTSKRLELMLKLAVEEKAREVPQPPAFGFMDSRLLPEVTVEWAHSEQGAWFDLDTLDLDHACFRGVAGVYLIWNSAGRCVRVGQGRIAERLGADRRDAAVRGTSLFSPFFATWAPLAEGLRDGVEMYLEERYKPTLGGSGLDVDAIKVNDPKV